MAWCAPRSSRHRQRCVDRSTRAPLLLLLLLPLHHHLLPPLPPLPPPPHLWPLRWVMVLWPPPAGAVAVAPAATGAATRSKRQVEEVRAVAEPRFSCQPSPLLPTSHLDAQHTTHTRLVTHVSAALLQVVHASEAVSRPMLSQLRSVVKRAIRIKKAVTAERQPCGVCTQCPKF